MLVEEDLIMGVKRKLDDVEEAAGDMRGSQRQSILDISMCKLRTTPVKRVEPPLLKSVLILNTLKHIETELIREGMPSTTPPFTLPEADTSSEILDFLPVPVNPPKMETDVPSSLGQSGPLPSIDTFVGNKLPSLDVKASVEPLDRIPAHISIADSISTSLYPSLRVEDMFGDLDFSLCDFDIFSSIANGMKLTPLSAEEVQHSFPNSNGSLNESYATLLGSGVSPFCKSEAALEDLDSIMQILVGS